MEKNTYETYQFMPNASTDTNADQFFVVQDDGTLLINRQVQYVAQVEDVKEVLENVQPVCTVYDVSSQQFFVDVDNSAELISVSDEFTLADAENGLYNNSYLLQPSSNITEEQMDEDIKDHQYEETNPHEVDINQMTRSTRQTTSCTEITLNDEQYRSLERNGWILLESNDKIFVLDTLGLHDITENYKLIQKLKNEIQSTNSEPEARYVKIQNIQSPLPNLVVQPLVDQRETVQFVVGINEQDENSGAGTLHCAFDEKESLKSEIDKFDVELQPQIESSQVEQERSEAPNNDKYLKIKTKLTFRDIPDKILLGKSLNGKNIVANVVKRQPLGDAEEPERAPRDAPPWALEYSADSRRYNDVIGTYESEFFNLIQQYGRGRCEGLCTSEDIATASAIVTRLVAMPDVKDQIIGHDLVITKVSHDRDKNGVLLSESSLKMVTGRVGLKDGAHVFEYKVDLLQKIKNTLGDGNSTRNDETEKDAKDFTIFHIHITQTKCKNNTTVSVNGNTRQVPVSVVADARRRHPRAVFACGACAAVFHWEHALEQHRESGKCSDADDVLTIDSDQFYIGCTVLHGQKEKLYVCTLCEAQFSKLNNCYRHVQTHALTKQQVVDATDLSKHREDCKEAEVYRCKMCPSTYLFPSSLSKHIVARHINMNEN